MIFKIIRDEGEFGPLLSRSHLVDFLYVNLGRFGDTKEEIARSIDYAFSTEPGKGGFILLGLDDDDGDNDGCGLVTALVMNKTGMSGYIPENVLVYVATKADARGKGYGTKTIQKGFDISGYRRKITCRL